MLINNINLSGKRIKYIGRACNLCWIGFGDEIQFLDSKNNLRKVAKYAFHIQCAFRMQHQNKIIITDKDMYYPKPNFEKNREFYWDVNGDNMFDYIAMHLNSVFEKEKIVVKNIELSGNFDLKIAMSNRYLLEIFNNCEEDTEYGEAWRFFESNSENMHFTVNRNNSTLS